MAKQFSKKPSFLKRCWQFTKCAALIMFVSSLLYVIVCKWVMPPITITQITNGFSYGLKRDYVGWNEMSYNVKLAAIASEDQAFPDHNGFDLDAIKKSFYLLKNSALWYLKVLLRGLYCVVQTAFPAIGQHF